MKVRLSARVEAEIARHFDYGVDHYGQLAAERTFQRLDRFITRTLAEFPRIGTIRSGTGLHETWVPRTPFVLIYRVDETADSLTVLALFHHAQDRSALGDLEQD